MIGQPEYIIDPTTDEKISDPVIIALVKELESSKVATSHGYNVGLEYRLSLANRLRKVVYYREPKGGDEFGLVGTVRLTTDEGLAAVGPIAVAVKECDGHWWFVDRKLSIRIQEPRSLSDAPAGTHEFAKGWLMARSAAKVDDALEKAGLPRMSWQPIEHSGGRVLRRLVGIVKT